MQDDSKAGSVYGLMSGDSTFDSKVPEKPPSFEVALEQLQMIVKKLEGGELGLEQALENFEAGVRLCRTCQTHLTAAEQKVEILSHQKTHSAVDLDPTSFQR